MINCASLISNTKTKRLIVAVRNILIAFSLISCSFQKYTPKPIDTSANTSKLALKNLNNADFNQYLASNGYAKEHLPIKQWGLKELTYCALFFHPNLDVARAQLRVAQASETAAAERTVPTINGNIAHSDDPDPTKKPLAFGLSIDIPIDTANKRDIRIENAQHLSQIAKLEIAQTAWNLRKNIAETLTEYQFNQAQLRLLSEEDSYRRKIVSILQKRVDVGAASKIEVSNANLQLQTVSTALNSAQQNQLVLLSRLASNIGLPLNQVQTITIKTETPRQITELPLQEIQTTALLNRLDIRIALERYAIAESKLKLEIAKQYPDLVISPGAAYEFGDHIWSLGITGLMTLLNKNKLGIAEASQIREVEAIQFEALQSQVILDTNIVNAEVNQAMQALENQQKLLFQQQTSTQRMQHQLAAGLIDQLEMTYARLEDINAEKNVALASFQLNKSLDQLENLLQKPFTDSTSTTNEAEIKAEGMK